jgi:replicative DNA helicase
MPQNMEAERSILGAILLDNNALNAANRETQARRFFPRPSPAHLPADDRNSARAQQAIDLVTLTDQLHRAANSKPQAAPPISRN